MCIYQVLLFTQIFILFYSPNPCDSWFHLEQCSIYWVIYNLLCQHIRTMINHLNHLFWWFKKLWCKYDACPLQNSQVLQRTCIIPHDHYHHTSSHICDTCFPIKLFHNIHCTKCFSSFCYLGYFLSAFCWTLLIIIKVSWYLGNSLMRHITSVWSWLVVVGHCMHMEFTSLIFYN